ncbi:hypothetical protein [Roseibium suaedae]|uniref:Uncharacterized protein n=2 Tax=Roseibium TaxID=150830 RepID=A0A1M7CHH6_9HYPH|nr:hypothetical protein [Roseibium suaedae]SHL66626.1 hypothetical protein SAMN05444272_1164 [Roseibium suaedae]
MTLVNVLKERSVWTYDVMAASSNMGEMIREDAITSVNLAFIQQQSNDNGFGLGTTSLQGAKLESEFGGDWIWNYAGYTMLVQAKKLDAIKGQDFYSYKIDIDQLRLAITSCSTGYFSEEKAGAYYVFYNSFLEGEKENIGCLMLKAEVLWKIICGSQQQEQKSAQVSPKQIETAGAEPWWKIFST